MKRIQFFKQLFYIFGLVIFFVLYKPQKVQAHPILRQPPLLVDQLISYTPEQYSFGNINLLKSFQILGNTRGISGSSKNENQFSRSNTILNNISGITIVDISAGFFHTCAITSEGDAKCWGRNNYGQLGNNSTTDSLRPVDVIGVNEDFIAISTGMHHSCALTTNGGVKCWGMGSWGQLGNGTYTNSLTPVDVIGLNEGVIAITAGDGHTCALTTAGGVKCWGDNGYHELGDGTGNRRNTPVDVIGLNNGVASISSKRNHTCAVMNTGGAKCWGSNYYGQLGDGTKSHRTIPVEVTGLSDNVISIKTGLGHTCILTTEDEVQCWGDNSAGQLGDGTNNNSLTPVSVAGLSNNITTIEAGTNHTCVKTVTGGAQCWGRNNKGQLGDGTTTYRNSPIEVVSLNKGVINISAAEDRTCAIISNGGVKCWGGNEYGQLGDSTTTDRPVPVSVVGLGKAQWTVMVYLDGDNSWESSENTKFEFMGEVGSSIDVNIIVQFDRALGFDNNYNDWQDAYRFYVTKGMKPWKENGIGLGEVDMGDENTLRNFIQWGKGDYPADHYALFLVDHGHGWTGIMSDAEEYSTFLQDVTTGETSGMEMNELRNALNDSTYGGAEPIDLLGIDACVMASIEVDSQLIPFVKYRIAHEDANLNEDWGYKDFLTELVKDPAMDAKVLGEWIMKDISTCDSESCNEDDYHKRALSFVDLGANYQTLIASTNNLADQLIQFSDEYENQILEARLKTQNFYFLNETRSFKYVYIDLYDFADHIDEIAISDEHDLIKAAKGVKDAITDVVPIMYDSNDNVINPLIKTSYWSGAHGISIYFPITDFYYNDQYDDDSSNPWHLQFAIDTLWDEWLNHYFTLQLEPVVVTVLDGDGNPEAGLSVQAYDDGTYTGFSAVTNSQGQASVLVYAAGDFRFKVTKDETEYWSGETNHCAIPGCTTAGITIGAPSIQPVVVTVLNPGGQPEPDLYVRAMIGDTETEFIAKTDAQGVATLTLPPGEYRFRVWKNNRYFWSGETNHCPVPGCTTASVTIDYTVNVTVLDTNGDPEAGMTVQAYDGATAVGITATTDAQGVAAFSLPEGSYRFQVVKNGTKFWSGTENHCGVPACTSAGITTTLPVTIIVLNRNGQPEPDVFVRAMIGTTQTEFVAKTDAQGVASLTLPQGSYRFAVWKNNRYFWSGETNHCTVPGCTTANITIDSTVVVTVMDTSGNPEAGIIVHAYIGSTSTGFMATTNSQGQAFLSLPAGSYRFRAFKNGTAFWSGPDNHCTVPTCTTASVTTTIPVVITVLDPGGLPEVGLKVWAMNGSTYAGVMALTDASGNATLTLPQGSYRFRVDKPGPLEGTGQQFWSGATNHCTVPGCTGVTVTIKDAVVITVLDTNGNPEAGLEVWAYDGTTFANASGNTNAQGQALLWLPAGNFRFRVLKNGTPFWSGTENHCAIPGCAVASITTTIPIVVSVLNPGGQPEMGLKVWAMNGDTYAGVMALTDASGNATLTLPQGSYRFRVDKPGPLEGTGQQFWSGATNHCMVPGCTGITVTTKDAVVITVLDTNGNPDTGLEVRAYDGTTFVNASGMTNAQGQALLWLPAGNFRFRVLKNGTAFWSGTENHCAIPGCSSAGIITDDGGVGMKTDLSGTENWIFFSPTWDIIAFKNIFI